MQLTPQVINEFKKMLLNPKEFNLPFESLDEIFEKSDEAIAKHLVYDSYLLWIKNRNVPKVVFYILMDEMFESKTAADGNFGYCVKFKL